ncbi:MAG: MBL fold metallo-hydrolase, partial [Halieaceae bacterium]|nr:MBL fold metallo-hydrolase [Halieaceae bacterium]
AWDDAQTRLILAWIERVLAQPVLAAVFTHAHQDKMGGAGALRKAGVATFAPRESNRLAPDRGLVPAEHDLDFTDDGELSGADRLPAFLQSEIDIFYPGPGHSIENIVVAVPGTPVLFGGCLIRAAGAVSLGGTGDAVIERWAASVARVGRRFSAYDVVVPSHGAPGSRDLLDLTLRLAHGAMRSDP